MSWLRNSSSSQFKQFDNKQKTKKMKSRLKSEDVGDEMHRIRREKCKKFIVFQHLSSFHCYGSDRRQEKSEIISCEILFPPKSPISPLSPDNISPWHSTWPSPSKPGLHLQTYSAGRLQHSAFSTHLAASSGMAHSSISENNKMKDGHDRITEINELEDLFGWYCLR